MCILKLRKLKKTPSQHKVSKGWCWDYIPGISDSEVGAYHHCALLCLEEWMNESGATSDGPFLAILVISWCITQSLCQCWNLLFVHGSWVPFSCNSTRLVLCLCLFYLLELDFMRKLLSGYFLSLQWTLKFADYWKGSSGYYLLILISSSPLVLIYVWVLC